jgi:hypothetical protein
LRHEEALYGRLVPPSRIETNRLNAQGSTKPTMVDLGDGDIAIQKPPGV